MNAAAQLQIGFCPRPEPLTAIAALIVRQEAFALLEREVTEGMVGLGIGEDLLLLAGYENLPWRPKIRYFGRSPLAPTLLLPTHSAPTIPVDIFERCVQSRYGYQGTLLVDPMARRVVGLPVDRPLTHQALQRFLRGGNP